MKDKITVPKLMKKKKSGEKIVMITSYDAIFSKILNELDLDIVLIGDSAGMVIQGHPNTLPVTMEDMIYHCRAVTRFITRAHTVGDMPFLSYQCSIEQAIMNAGRLIKEGGVESIKLEGGLHMAKTVQALTQIGIPVMAHIGLTPQSVHQFGGYKIQGRKKEHADSLMEAAKALEDAGAYSIVLEGIPKELAKSITESISIPTIGIGAGAGCDGQVLVIYDLLGMDPLFRPKFVKQYDNLYDRIKNAVEKYSSEVRSGVFPGDEYSFD